MVLYLCFSSSFLFNVLMIRHFIMVNTLDMVESGCSRTWHMSIIQCNSDTVESGYYLHQCADWSLYPGGVKTSELVYTRQSQEGPGEGRRYLALWQNHARVQWRKKCQRQKVSFLYAHVCPCSTHTFSEKLQSWVSKPTNTEYTPISWEKPEFFMLFLYKTLA